MPQPKWKLSALKENEKITSIESRSALHQSAIYTTIIYLSLPLTHTHTHSRSNFLWGKREKLGPAGWDAEMLIYWDAEIACNLRCQQISSASAANETVCVLAAGCAKSIQIFPLPKTTRVIKCSSQHSTKESLKEKCEKGWKDIGYCNYV